jgi:hypothetical protein
MNKRRSICSLLGKSALIAFWSPKVFPTVVHSPKKINNALEFTFNLASFPQKNQPLHLKLQPGEKIKINIIKNNFKHASLITKSISFQMPLVSLRPYFVFLEPKQNYDFPLLVFSAKGMPLKAN